MTRSVLSPLGCASLGSALLLALAFGCAEPPVAFVPPTGNPASPGNPSSVQSRVLPIARDQVFPKVLSVLMDMGYQVRCVNPDLGQVNIYQTWYDTTLAARPELSLEATLLFLPENASQTRVRVVATGHWGYISVGRNNSATVTGAQPVLEAGDSLQFLEQLQARLCPAATPSH